MNTDTFDKIKLNEDLVIIETPLGDMKYFYLFDKDNIPVHLSYMINPKKLSYSID